MKGKHLVRNKFELGDKATDQIQNVSGVIVTISLSLTGCLRYCVTTPATKDKESKDSWCSELDLKLDRKSDREYAKNRPVFDLGDLVKERVSERKFVVVATTFSHAGYTRYSCRMHKALADKEISEWYSFDEIELTKVKSLFEADYMWNPAVFGAVAAPAVTPPRAGPLRSEARR